jgi:AbrB family looped-hinge helix DNA binding protein
MSYETKVTRQGQTTIPKPLRDRYDIREGNVVTYLDLGDHIAVLPVPDDAVAVLESLGIKAKESVSEMKKESLETARNLVSKKLGR